MDGFPATAQACLVDQIDFWPLAKGDHVGDHGLFCNEKNIELPNCKVVPRQPLLRNYCGFCGYPRDKLLLVADTAV